MAGISMTNPKKLAACFREAGFEWDITHFDQRLIAQKLVYLLEELGVRLGYKGTFSFYLRGTYSPTLTKDLFQMQGQDHDETELKLSAADRARIARLVSTVQLRPHMLEVMAAYRFLRTQGKSEDEAIRKIKATKPFISERDVAIGISKCKGIFPEIAPRDLEELDQEMAPWDAATREDE
jgi:uncharacterized protein YwgA